MTFASRVLGKITPDALLPHLVAHSKNRRSKSFHRTPNFSNTYLNIDLDILSHLNPEIQLIFHCCNIDIVKWLAQPEFSLNALFPNLEEIFITTENCKKSDIEKNIRKTVAALTLIIKEGYRGNLLNAAISVEAVDLVAYLLSIADPHREILSSDDNIIVANKEIFLLLQNYRDKKKLSWKLIHTPDLSTPSEIATPSPIPAEVKMAEIPIAAEISSSPPSGSPMSLTPKSDSPIASTYRRTLAALTESDPKPIPFDSSAEMIKHPIDSSDSHALTPSCVPAQISSGSISSKEGSKISAGQKQRFFSLRAIKTAPDLSSNTIDSRTLDPAPEGDPDSKTSSRRRKSLLGNGKNSEPLTLTNEITGNRSSSPSPR